jgi:hypothetical protein
MSPASAGAAQATGRRRRIHFPADRELEVLDRNGDAHAAGLQSCPLAALLERGDPALPARPYCPGPHPDAPGTGTLGTIRAAARARAPAGGPAALGPLQVLVQAALRDRLALELAADAADLGPELVHDSLGLVAGRLERLVALAPGLAPLFVRCGEGRPGLLLGQAGPARASVVSFSVALIDASVSSNACCSSVRRDRASSTIELESPSRSAIAKAWLWPGKPIVSLYVGRRVSTSNSTEAFRGLESCGRTA